MKRLLLLVFYFASLSIGAQTIRYDTIKVSPDDERNIHLNRSVKAQSSNQSFSKESTNAVRLPAAFDKSKLRFGANLGLSASRNYTYLGIGPQIGYQFSDYFMTGAGLKYYYMKTRTSYYVIKNNLLGANLFGYVYPVKFITIFMQPEINYIWSTLTPRTSDGTKEKDMGLVPSVVVGAGFRLGRSHITLNYDLTQHANSPHPSGIYLGISAFF